LNQINIPDLHSLADRLRLPAATLCHSASRIKNFYRSKPIPKGDGSVRNLLVPCGMLKLIQKRIKEEILDEVNWVSCVYGGIRKRSTKANAQVHVGQPVVYTLDIKSFFPSVRPERVVAAFVRLGIAEKPARLLARLTTFEHQLPQGTHTSTALANLVLYRADVRICTLAKQQGFTYTRFVDDISLSGSIRLMDFRNLIMRIIEEEGFQIKEEKKLTLTSGMSQIVTKLTVNTVVNLTRQKRKEIRTAVFEDAQKAYGDLSIRTRGQLAWLSYINPGAGAKLAMRAEAITMAQP
jgi:retron-type reverse transcriptase